MYLYGGAVSSLCPCAEGRPTLAPPITEWRMDGVYKSTHLHLIQTLLFSLTKYEQKKRFLNPVKFYFWHIGQRVYLQSFWVSAQTIINNTVWVISEWRGIKFTLKNVGIGTLIWGRHSTELCNYLLFKHTPTVFVCLSVWVDAGDWGHR